MSRAHVETRVSEQIRTLFQAGSLGRSPTASCSTVIFRLTGPARRSRLRLSWNGTDRWSWACADGCWLMPTSPKTPSRPHFSSWRDAARSVRNHDSLGGWLHRVARRIAMRLRSAHERQKTREQPGNVEAAVQDPDHAVQNELKSAIDQEIDRLAESHRLPVVLCCLEGISHEEAAQRLRWPLGTVKSRLARGKKRLQERLVRKGFAPSAALAAAAGTGLLGSEASAAVPPALIDATAKAAAAVASGATLAGVVPAPLSALVGQELSTMIASKLTLTLGIPLAAGASAAFVGFILAAAPSSKPEASPAVPAAAKQRNQPQAKAEPAATPVKLSATGTVTDPAGQPIAGARVILREWSVYRVRGMPPKQTENLFRGEELQDTLMETTTDEAGRFRFDNVTAPSFPHVPEAGQTVYPWDIVVLAQGHGLAWVQLTPQHQRAPITLKLGPEKTIRGRVIEPGGKPVPGAKIKIHGIDPLGRPLGNGLQTENRLNLIWSAFPLGATTDADGRFIVAGIPPEHVATLIVTESRHERLAVYAATTDKPQPENVATYYYSGQPREVREPVYSGELTLTAKPANHVLKGRVVFESDGKPAAGGYVNYNGSNITVDDNGLFRIEGLAAGKIELHAHHFSSNAAPRVAQIEIPETPTEIERTITLPPGLIITGRVVDEATGQPVAKAMVDFTPAPDPKAPLSSFALWKETDRDGKFRLVLPPGRGTIFLRTIPIQFPQPEREFTGQPKDPRLNREVSGAGGQTVDIGDFKLAAGRTIVLRVVDPDGQPMPDAEILVRDPNRMFDKTGPAHSDAAGRATLGGLPIETSTIVDIIAMKRSLGAMVEVPDAASAGANNREIEARLQPLLSLSGACSTKPANPSPVPSFTCTATSSIPVRAGGRSACQSEL